METFYFFNCFSQYVFLSEGKTHNPKNPHSPLSTFFHTLQLLFSSFPVTVSRFYTEWKLCAIWIIIHVALLPCHAQCFVSVIHKLFCYQGFLWRVTKLPRAFAFSISVLSSCPAGATWLFWPISEPFLSTWYKFWYPFFFHLLLPSGPFIILFPASSEYLFLFSEFQCFSLKKEMRLWEQYRRFPASVAGLLLFLHSHISSLFLPRKTRFLLSATEVACSGDRCCHSCLLVSSSYPWDTAGIFCHLWICQGFLLLL